MREKDTGAVINRALILFVILSLALGSRTALSDPTDTDNFDGTMTLRWNFTNSSDYQVQNVSVEPGYANLSLYDIFWNQTSYQDFNNATETNNLEFTPTGEAMLLLDTDIQILKNGNFSSPDTGSSADNWKYEKLGNYMVYSQTRESTGGINDNGFCWRNLFVDLSAGAGYNQNVWLNQTINVTSIPLNVNVTAFYNFTHSSTGLSPGSLAEIYITNLNTNLTYNINSTGWVIPAYSNYQPLRSTDSTPFNETGLYNITLFTRTDTTGDVTHTDNPSGIANFWDDASVLLDVYKSQGNYTSQVFDAGSYAMWKNVSWAENLPYGTDINVFVRTGNSTVPTDSIWSNWSSPLTYSSGSQIDRPWSQYIQYRVEFNTLYTNVTPTLSNITITYEKYHLGGVVETADFSPSSLVRWGRFSHLEDVNGQTVSFQYSTDSGSIWSDVPIDGDLRSLPIGSAPGAKIRFRASLNTTDAVMTPSVHMMELTYVSISPAFTLEPVWDSQGASPNDVIRIHIYFNNTAVSNSSTAWLNVYLDENLEYVANNSQTLGVFQAFIPDANPNIQKYVFSNIPSSQNMLWVDARVMPGVIDGDTLQTTVTLDYLDPLENRVESILSPAPIRVNGPVMLATLLSNGETADVGDIIHYNICLNNTGRGTASKVWLNGTLDDRLEGQNLTWTLDNVSGNSSTLISFNATLKNNVAQGSSIQVWLSVAYSDTGGYVREAETNVVIITARLRSGLNLTLASQSEQVNSDDILVMTVLFNNTGYGSAQTVRFNLSIPDGMEFIASSEECTQASSECIWELSDIAPGAHSFTLTLKAKKPDNGTASCLMIMYMQVVDPVDGLMPVISSNQVSISITRIYTSWEKIYWPWSGLGIAIVLSLVGVLLFYFLKPVPPSIDNVFVMYKDGRLICHRKSKKGETSKLDGDLVSAMLTATQDFVSDSLSKDRSKKMKKIEFGDRELYLERGAYITLAVTYSHSMSKKLQNEIAELIAKIEVDHPNLAKWDGRMTQLADISPLVDALIEKWQSLKDD